MLESFNTERLKNYTITEVATQARLLVKISVIVYTTDKNYATC